MDFTQSFDGIEEIEASVTVKPKPLSDKQNRPIGIYKPVCLNAIK